jgi:hypothetical protein
MVRASVPETSINKDCQAFPAKYKIGFPVQALIPSPAFDSAFTEDDHQFQLGIFVSFAAD